jgi:hypothetical protein
MGHRRACCYVPYTIHRGPQTQYEALICKTTRDSALCVPHSLEERTGAPTERVCVRTPTTRTGEPRGGAYPYLMREHPEPRPTDHTDVAPEIARDLADLVGQLASLKGKARAWLHEPDYNTLKLRLEAAHSAVEAAAIEARRRVRLNEG